MTGRDPQVDEAMADLEATADAGNHLRRQTSVVVAVAVIASIAGTAFLYAVAILFLHDRADRQAQARRDEATTQAYRDLYGITGDTNRLLRRALGEPPPTLPVPPTLPATRDDRAASTPPSSATTPTSSPPASSVPPPSQAPRPSPTTPPPTSPASPATSAPPAAPGPTSSTTAVVLPLPFPLPLPSVSLPASPAGADVTPPSVDLLAVAAIFAVFGLAGLAVGAATGRRHHRRRRDRRG